MIELPGIAIGKGRSGNKMQKSYVPYVLLIVMALVAMIAMPLHTPYAGDKKDLTDMKKIEKEFYKKRKIENNKEMEPDAYDKALEQWRKIQRTVPAHKPSPSSFTTSMPTEAVALSAVTGLLGTTWKPIGPSPVVSDYLDGGCSGTQYFGQVNGRVSSIAVNPNNPNVIYLGASGGGVWRTIDGGSTWTPLTDQQPSLGTGEPSAIAIDPSNTNTLYVGTSGRFVMNISKGILKSTDGGGSWIVLGSDFPADNSGNADDLFSGESINAIIVDPDDSDVLYLASTIGLYRSIDGGRNWTQGNLGAGDARSLAIDATSPANARILYAGVSGSGVRQSTDGGQNWTQILNAATPAVAAALTGGGAFGHVVVALAPPETPPDPAGIQVLYVTMAKTGGPAAVPDPIGIFQSTDQGTNWTDRLATFTGWGAGTQGGYDLTMGVDPASPGNGASDILYVGMVGQFKSVDSGSNFSATANFQHVDTHAGWVFVPQPPPTPSIVLTGNDGGIYRSVDGGASWTGTGQPGAPPTINAGGLQIALFYNLDVKNDATASATAGSCQDLGTPQTTGSMTWGDIQGGDGWDFAFDAVTTNNAYNSSGFWGAPCTRVTKSTDSGATFPRCLFNPPTPHDPNDVTPWYTSGTDAGCYLAPINADPSQADVIYASGSQNIWQTQDGGGNWDIIANIGGQAQVKVAKANSNNVVAASGAQVFVSTNATAGTGATFTNITRNLPNRGVTRVAFDPNDPTVVYALLGGFNTQTPSDPGHVFRTTISGSTWDDISPALDVPFNAIALDGVPAPTAIYVGTDLGVMRSVDDGASWTVLDDVHLPNVPVTDLVINSQAGVLRTSTYGRGVFELAAPDGPVISVNAEDGLQFGTACQGSPLSLNLTVYNVGTQDLVINSVHRLFGSSSFTVLPNPSTPLVISPNSSADFTVQYSPTITEPESAQIRISSNDPSAPYFDLMATGTGGVCEITTIIANSGSFGDVCRGSFKDLPLTINDAGNCDLTVTGILSSLPAEFKVPSVVSFPLVISAGGSTQVPIRFEPTSIGSKATDITVTSNDPATPSKVVAVSGNVPSGDIKVTGSTNFGDVCAETQAEKTIKVHNVGKCNLNVASAAFDPACTDFTLVNNPFPAPVSPDSNVDLVIRFTPTSVGTKSCNLVIASDDPDEGSVSLTVTANTPTPSIDVPADLAFPPTVIQSTGACQSGKPFPVSNTGTCNLAITDITLGGENEGDYSLSGLPSFPIILEPGHVAGEGNLEAVFKPAALDRDRIGSVMVTYISDPITGATTDVPVPPAPLCGEGVDTGARVLVQVGGVPVNMVEMIKLQRINANRNKKKNLDTNDVAKNVPLTMVTPASSCMPFQFHREYGTVDNPVQLLPGSYQVTATVRINGKRKSKTVGFDVTTCGFNQNIVINF